MIIRAPPKWPVIFAIWFRDGEIVDGRKAKGHEPVVIELPILVAIGSIPVTRVVVPFVGEANRDAIAGKRPELLDEPVVQLLRPLPREKRNDFLASVENSARFLQRESIA